VTVDDLIQPGTTGARCDIAAGPAVVLPRFPAEPCQPRGGSCD
jgi:hypothetical protein